MEYARTVQKIIVTDRFGSPVDERNSFVLLSCGGEKSVVQRAAKVLLLFTINVRGDIKSTEHLFLQYMGVIGPLGMVHERLGRVCLTWSTDDEVHHRLRNATRISGKGGSVVKNGLAYSIWKLYMTACMS